MRVTKGRRAGGGALPWDGLVVDNFAGGGGASLGIERALGRAVDVAINHDREAVAMHAANHPHTRHYTEDVFDVDPAQVTGGRRVDLCWFSPDCKHFSRAKGAKPVSKRIRGLAWVVVRWARAVAPSVIVLENVREFETWGPVVPLVRDGTPVVGPDGSPRHVPCPRRKGRTFRLFVSKLRRAGYAVEWRVLDAADFGAPTHRRRLFLVARRDGEPIRWPGPTHGPGRPLPHRTAAECIDWSLPCPSIFLTAEEGRSAGVRRPLAEKTLRRIAMGLRRYVLDSPSPFIVRCQHGRDEFRGQGVGKPLGTITARHGYGLCAPWMMQQNGEAPHQETRGRRADRPAGTLTPRGSGGFPLIAAHLSHYHHDKAGETRASSPGGPLHTLDSSNRYALTAAFPAKHYGGVVGHPPGVPLGTITSVDHHSVAAGGNHHAAVLAFLAKYYGEGVGQAPGLPLGTLTSRHRFGLVEVQGVPHAIVDVGMRMLTPRELFRCQGFPDTYAIDPPAPSRSGRLRRLPADAQVRMVGNSVCPQVAEAVVRANAPSASLASPVKGAV